MRTNKYFASVTSKFILIIQSLEITNTSANLQIGRSAGKSRDRIIKMN